MSYALLNFREGSMGKIPRVFFRIGSWAPTVCLAVVFLDFLGAMLSAVAGE